MRDIRFLERKRLQHKQESLLIAADFETGLWLKEHFVIAWGFYFWSEKANSFIYLSKTVDNKKFIGPIKLESISLLFDFIKELCIVASVEKNKLLVYFHNFSSFDGLFLLKAFSFYEQITIKLDPRIIFRDNKVFEIACRACNKTFLVFRDSSFLIKVSLKEASRIFFGRSLKVPFNFRQIPNGVAFFQNQFLFRQLLFYLKNDCKILFFILVKFRKRVFFLYNLDILEFLTLSSLAFAVFRSRYFQAAENKIYTFSTEDEISYNKEKFIRAAYYGGIVEVYKPYGENLYLYDINSSYPNVMARRSMPIGFPQWEEVDLVKFINNRVFGFLKVLVKVRKHKYPFLGFLDKKGGRLLYCSGIFVTTVFSEELYYAIDRYDVLIINTKKILRFEKSKIFSQYTTTLYNQRLKLKDSNLMDNFILKVLLNALYGRFGIKNVIHESAFLPVSISNLYEYTNITHTIISPNYLYGPRYVLTNLEYTKRTLRIFLKKTEAVHRFSTDLNAIRLLVMQKLKKIRLSNSSPQISAAISAYARIELNKFQSDCISRGGSLYYADTDSFVTDKAYSKTHLVSNKLGGLKLQKRIKKGWFLESKLYQTIDFSFKVERVIRGFPSLVQNEIPHSFFTKSLRPLFSEGFSVILLSGINKNINYLQIYSAYLKFSLKSEGFFKQDKRKKVLKFPQGIWFDTKPYRVTRLRIKIDS